MEENAKCLDGGDKTLSISILKLNNLHVLLYFFTYKLRVDILWYVKTICCFLDSYVLYSFTHTFSTYYVGLLFAHTVRWHESLYLMCNVCIIHDCICLYKSGMRHV